MEKNRCFVIDQENFDCDFLIGLDCIKRFYLNQNKNLEISEKVPIQRNEIKNAETNNISKKMESIESRTNKKVSKETKTKSLESDKISKDIKNKESKIKNEIITT